jgi:hypothetical protein
MLKAIKTLIFGDQVAREAALPYHLRQPGPDHVATFSISNPACYGRSEPTGTPSKDFILFFFKFKMNEMHASEIEFALESLPKYDIWTDYYIEEAWPSSGFRRADMVESYCYEKDI